MACLWNPLSYCLWNVKTLFKDQMLIEKINVISSRAFEILLQLYSVIDLFKLIGEQTANIKSTMLKNTRLK